MQCSTHKYPDIADEIIEAVAWSIDAYENIQKIYTRTFEHVTSRKLKFDNRLSFVNDIPPT